MWDLFKSICRLIIWVIIVFCKFRVFGVCNIMVVVGVIGLLEDILSLWFIIVIFFFCDEVGMVIRIFFIFFKL